MSADRETNHDMTHRDIAFLLADAADEAEIGIAPTRRWSAVAAAARPAAGHWRQRRRW